jgi:hypothetical protein
MVPMSPTTNRMNTFCRCFWTCRSIAPAVSRPLSSVRAVSSSRYDDTASQLRGGTYQSFRYRDEVVVCRDSRSQRRTRTTATTATHSSADRRQQDGYEALVRSRPESGCSVGRFRGQEARQRPRCGGRSRQRAGRNTPPLARGGVGTLALRWNHNARTLDATSNRAGLKGAARSTKHADASTATSEASEERSEARESSGRGLSTGVDCRYRSSRNKES